MRDLINLKNLDLKITPTNGSLSKENLISFFRKLTDKNPSWTMSYQARDESLQFIHTDAFDNSRRTVLSMSMDGKLSVSVDENNEEVEHINQLDHTPTRLEVGGAIKAPARCGTALTLDASIPADGKFHPVTEKLFGVQALEVVATLECREHARFSILHAIALNAHNPRWKIITIFGTARVGYVSINHITAVRGTGLSCAGSLCRMRIILA